ncbi:MAG: hypothetical protein ACK476_11350, partial [Fluviicola sp.]
MKTLIYFFTYFLMNSCFSQIDTNKYSTYKSQEILVSERNDDSLKLHNEIPAPLICSIPIDLQACPYNKMNAQKEIAKNEYTYVVRCGWGCNFDEEKAKEIAVNYRINIATIGCVILWNVETEDIE